MFVEVEGARLWVEHDGDGPVIVVPTVAGVEYYRRTLSRWLRMAHHMVYVEMRSTGGSSGSLDGRTAADLADDVASVCSTLGYRQVIAMGHSGHASIVAEFALRHPDHCRGAVCVAGVGDGRESFSIGSTGWEREATAAQKEDLAARTAAFARREEASADVAAVDGYLAYAPLTWRAPELAWPSWGSYPGNVAAGLGWIRAQTPTWHVVDRLDGLRVPMLVISGRYDYVSPVETWTAALRNAPLARLEVFEQSSHNPQVEEQDRFDALVRTFVDERQG